MSYDPRTARTWAEVDLGAVARNVRTLAATFAPPGSGDAIIAVVKADAYGHGIVPVARACAAAGVAHFAVATVDEALTLRQAGITSNVYLLAPFLPAEAEAIVRGDVTAFVSSPAHFHALAGAARNAPLPARAFLCVDTGMGREGMPPGEARDLWNAAKDNPSVRFCGITSHLSSADDSEPAGTDATRQQAATFAAFVSTVADALPNADDGRGNRGVWLSLCNSPGTVRCGEWAATDAPHPPGVRGVLYRAGLLLYGIEPHAGAFAALPGVRQALAWRARVTLVRDLPEGATVGYGRTHTLARPSRVATVAAGYADGYPRRLSNRGSVLLRGQHYRVIGRVSMDQMQVDVTDAEPPVTPSDVVTLIGTDGNAALPTLAFAESIGATAHEPTCYLTSRVPRFYAG